MTMKSYSEDMARTTQTRERQSRMSCVVDEPDTCEDSDDTHASLYTEGGAKVRNECGVEQVSEGSNPHQHFTVLRPPSGSAYGRASIVIENAKCPHTTILS